MVWQICVLYANGTEKVLRSFRNRESAIRGIDAIYSAGYPMHMAYVIRPAETALQTA